MWKILARINPHFRKAVYTLGCLQRDIERKLWRKGLIGHNERVTEIRNSGNGYYVWEDNEDWHGTDD